MKQKVLILKRDDFSYDVDKLYSWFKEGFGLIWGDNLKFSQQEVLLKPNLLMEADASLAITTHPNFIVALARFLKDRGLSVFVADNPGGFGSNYSIRRIYQSLGLDRYPQLFTLLYNDKPPFKEGDINFSWWAKGFELVNIPKLKTHDLMGLTAAVKNLYGLIPGISKSEFHKRYPKPDDFAAFILRIYQLFQPRFNILDGIVSLEGEGPARGGLPRPRGIIIFSDSALALDYILAELIGLLPEKLPHLKIALNMGLIKEDLIEVYPQNWREFKIKDFIFSSPSFIENIPKPLLKMLGGILEFYPFIDNKKCVKCKDCLKVCPASAIKIIGQRTGIELTKCIKCMCCFEVCRYSAVGVKESFVLGCLKKIHRCLQSFKSKGYLR